MTWTRRLVTILTLSGAVILALAGSATAQTPALQIYTSFAGQYDTAMGWRPDYGNPSVGNPMAEPTIAAGVYQGQTRLLIAADNSIGQFYNALQGPDDIHNAQQDLASTLAGVLPPGFIATQPRLEYHLRSPTDNHNFPWQIGKSGKLVRIYGAVPIQGN